MSIYHKSPNVSKILKVDPDTDSLLTTGIMKDREEERKINTSQLIWQPDLWLTLGHQSNAQTHPPTYSTKSFLQEDIMRDILICIN